MPQLGKPILFTNEELEELAEITEKDIGRVQNNWQKTVRPWARNLLVAEEANANDTNNS